jgi:regulator of CtrA degradation
MKDKSRIEFSEAAESVTVSFGERFQASAQFDRVFKEGMGLVERTAAYLDGEGRKAAKALAGKTTVLYTTESMRLTTRLLDLASWLLIRRALKDGEITEAEAQKKRARVKLQSLGRPSHIRGFGDLPEGLQRLIEESFALHDRIVQLDLAMAAPRGEVQIAPVLSSNPVGAQLSRIERAFAHKLN